MKTMIRPEEISSILQQELVHFTSKPQLEEIGYVLQVSGGIVKVHGLSHVEAGELIRFENELQGLVLNLEEDHIGAIVLGATHTIKEGDMVRRTQQMASIAVGYGMLGRVIDTLGNPIDGKGPLTGPLYPMLLERKAPGVIYREPVSEPLQTGIKAIDSMIPIGRGQRELIVGDRQTGKTTIALDTIINQRRLFEQGRPVYCIYVAVGQKSSSIAQVVQVLETYGALPYTTLVAAPAAAPAALQYLAPFAGTALGEYLRDTGQHALIVYDDLSKHADAYREVSLLLRRPPGREAYPGDIFFLHSRLLERAAKINHNTEIAKQMNNLPESLQSQFKAGGSLTALPIVETQAGDVAAYIPTNVISITDGQVFLEKNLFNADMRPAINVGISVSRVGGAAQTQLMRKLAGTLKLNQAQFLELEAFAKFGSSLDPATQRIIQRGKVNQQIFKQPAYTPLALSHQLAILYIATEGYLDSLPLEQVKKFEEKFHFTLLEEHPSLLAELEAGRLEQATKETLSTVAKQVIYRLT